MEVDRVFLLMPEENTVVTFDKNKWDQFTYAPFTSCKLLALLPDEEVALIDQDEFSRIVNQDASRYTNFSSKPVAFLLTARMN